MKIIEKILVMLNEAMLKKQYLGKNFTWKVSQTDDVKVGDPVRCMGVYNSESMGGLVLNMSTGMPVPVNQIGTFLQPLDFDPSEAAMQLDLNKPKEQKPKRDMSSMTQEELLGKKVDVQSNITQQPAAVVQTVVKDDSVVVKQVPKVDVFNGFKKSERDFNMCLSLELPSMDLLEVMYENSDDKNKFLTDFANYILSCLDVKDVVASLEKQFKKEDVVEEINKNKTEENDE